MIVSTFSVLVMLPTSPAQPYQKERGWLLVELWCAGFKESDGGSTTLRPNFIRVTDVLVTKLEMVSTNREIRQYTLQHINNQYYG